MSELTGLYKVTIMRRSDEGSPTYDQIRINPPMPPEGYPVTLISGTHEQSFSAQDKGELIQGGPPLRLWTAGVQGDTLVGYEEGFFEKAARTDDPFHADFFTVFQAERIDSK